MTTALTISACKEQVRLDHDRLNLLYADVGLREAEDMLCRAMEELALRLGQAERLWRGGELQELRRCVRALGAIAGQIGLDGIVAVARDVGACVDRQDSVALAAVLARLLRLGEASLSELWDSAVVNL
ncbi:hypothetical protein [Litorisediminicola beolgyonensis]|uniref:Hpt domain protein n=1 Tax=Litorisediminicola beolgyonensis TaxID=1173614 RepID=A0ABW3ZHP8_9RHOB